MAAAAAAAQMAAPPSSNRNRAASARATRPRAAATCRVRRPTGAPAAARPACRPAPSLTAFPNVTNAFRTSGCRPGHRPLWIYPRALRPQLPTWARRRDLRYTSASTPAPRTDTRRPAATIPTCPPRKWVSHTTLSSLYFLFFDLRNLESGCTSRVKVFYV